MSDTVLVSLIVGAFGTLNTILLLKFGKRMNGRLTQLMEATGQKERSEGRNEGGDAARLISADALKAADGVRADAAVEADRVKKENP